MDFVARFQFRHWDRSGKKFRNFYFKRLFTNLLRLTTANPKGFANMSISPWLNLLSPTFHFSTKPKQNFSFCTKSAMFRVYFRTSNIYLLRPQKPLEKNAKDI